MRKIGLVGKKVARENKKEVKVVMYVHRSAVSKWEMLDKYTRLSNTPKDRFVGFISEEGAIFHHKNWNKWRNRFVVRGVIR